MSKSVLKMLISGLKISMSGLKILISGLTISMSGLKPSLFGLKISTSRVRARSQTLAPIFPSGRFITRLLSRPYSKIRSVPAAKCPLPQKGYQKPKRKSKTKLFSVSFRNSKNCFHSAQQQKSQIRIYSGSFSLTPTDNSTGARSTADRRPSAPTRPRCPPTTSQKTPDRHQASTLKSHKSFESDAIRSETPERTYVYQHHSAVPTDKKGTPNKKGPKSTKKHSRALHQGTTGSQHKKPHKTGTKHRQLSHTQPRPTPDHSRAAHHTSSTSTHRHSGIVQKSAEEVEEVKEKWNPIQPHSSLL